MFVADTTDRLPKGTLRGRRLSLHVHSYGQRAAGSVAIRGISHGARRDRSPITTQPAGGFDRSRWVTGWFLEHDRFHGILRVVQLDPFLATFGDAQKHQHQVSGGLDSSHRHILWLDVPLPGAAPQRLLLYHHTREDGAVSGTTQWQGVPYAVHGQLFTEPKYPPFAPPGEGVLASTSTPLRPTGICSGIATTGPATAPATGRAIAPSAGAGSTCARCCPPAATLCTPSTRTATCASLPAATACSKAVKDDGTLRWHPHLAVETGEGIETPGAWAETTRRGDLLERLPSRLLHRQGHHLRRPPRRTLHWWRHRAPAAGRPVDAP